MKIVCLKNRGQMSAPFELFVAVIIMGFVIIIGSQMLSTVNREVCLNNIDKQLSDFKTNIENTANHKNSIKFYFDNPNDCFNEKIAKINIQHERKNPRLCSLICGQATDDCYFLSFIISKEGADNISKQKCLSISRFSTFLTAAAASECDPNDLGEGYDGYNAIDPQFSLPIGNYILRNVSSPGEPYPKICTFYKK
jgi:hypothetical protein